MSTSATTSPPALDDIDEVSILVIDDEPALTEVMAVALGSRQFKVTVATNGEQALAAATVDPPDIVVLDLGLPDIDGIDVCRQLRRWFANPIIVLSADGAESRKVEALDAGADDYVTKPFSMPELLARLRVALRHRRLVASVADPTVLEVGDVTIDTGAHVVSVAGTPLDLTRKEFALLALLARNLGKVIIHQSVLNSVWSGTQRGTTESLRVHVTNLRRKLGTGAQRPQVLTEPGVGYRLVLPDEV